MLYKLFNNNKKYSQMWNFTSCAFFLGLKFDSSTAEFVYRWLEKRCLLAKQELMQISFKCTKSYLLIPLRTLESKMLSLLKQTLTDDTFIWKCHSKQIILLEQFKAMCKQIWRYELRRLSIPVQDKTDCACVSRMNEWINESFY